MRKMCLALILAGLAAIPGCSNGESTNPKELPPLTAEDQAKIKARDVEITNEEDSMRVEPVKAKAGAKR